MLSQQFFVCSTLPSPQAKVGLTGLAAVLGQLQIAAIQQNSRGRAVLRTTTLPKSRFNCISRASPRRPSKSEGVLGDAAYIRAPKDRLHSWSLRVEQAAPPRRRPSPAAARSRRRGSLQPEPSRRRASPPREPSRRGARPRTATASRTPYKPEGSTLWSSSSCCASWSSSRKAATSLREAHRHPKQAGTPRPRRPSLYSASSR